MKDTKKGYRDGEVLRAVVTPYLASLIERAGRAADGGLVGVDELLAQVPPRRLDKASLRTTRAADEQAALAEERAGL